MWMPAKFGFAMCLAFGMWMALFKYFESQATAHGPMYAELPMFVFILALLPATSGLLAMTETYLGMWSREKHLARYLRKLGIPSN
jgi:hypothetical protein